jgi:hypothetical protein
VKLTKADRTVLRQAVDDAARQWLQASRNYEVMSRATGGGWHVEAATAGRKYRALKRRLAGLEKAVAKLAI